MLVRSLFALTAVALVASVSLARENESEGRNGSGGRRARSTHDVRVQISKAKVTDGGTRVRVTVQNRGRVAESGVAVAVFSDADPATPVWETTTDLRRKGHARWQLTLEVPEGTTALTARCDLAGTAGTGGADEDEDDNEDTTPVTPAPDDGTMTAAERGAAIFIPQCSSCHGATGTGGTVDENISREDADEIREAVREGEDGMPVFPSITAQDARDIAAYLRNPVTPPTDPGTGGGGTGGGGTGGGGTGGGGTGGGGTGGGGTTTVTYTGRIAAIMSANCTACHTGKNAAKSVKLDTFANVSANATRALAAIQGRTMPPGGALSAGDTQAFQDWVSGGKTK